MAPHPISRHFGSPLTQLGGEVVVGLKQNGINNKVENNNLPHQR